MKGWIFVFTHRAKIVSVFASEVKELLKQGNSPCCTDQRLYFGALNTGYFIFVLHFCSQIVVLCGNIQFLFSEKFKTYNG